ncbi:hypothetical protein BOTBODRAFT_331922 [Botryobasidium botryosum FD-172 SS1]|uniref:DUF7918 domain-containing protein n=1 Tax=Botryobasidium botryosum (strain FD-172 SS1) TaxID=930990 RepID=A0A067MTK4_BOTB1|nr:hypothetical protein BOTBODRAFT_331922 [Botryobasidium botryosum FD-172 SS1]
MLTHQGFSAWIVSEGKRLETFKPEIEDLEEGEDKVMSGWTPSEAGKKFSVHWRDNKGGMETVGCLFIDGSPAGEGAIDGRTWKSQSLPGHFVSEDEFRPFQFSKLQVTNDESAGTAPSDELGEIILIIRRCIIGGPSSFKQESFGEQGPVHEKAKKGHFHQITLADSKELSCHKPWHTWRPYSEEDAKAPLVFFVFNYRPWDLLQKEGVTPRRSLRHRIKAEPNPHRVLDEAEVVIKREDEEPVGETGIRAESSPNRVLEQGG